MYFGKNNHILSKTLIIAALINIAAAALQSVIRIMVERKYALMPVMADDLLWRSQIVVSVLQLIAVTVLFLRARQKIKRMLSLISRDDMYELGRLQEDAFGKDISALKAGEISKLLQVWTAILVVMQLVYDINSLIYRNFILRLIQALGSDMIIFSSLYNDSHGFKYMGMLMVLILGVMITGIFLDDRFLKIGSLTFMMLYFVSVVFFGITRISLFGKDYGIVLSSVAFHAAQTGGLLIFAFYLRRKYNGV